MAEEGSRLSEASSGEGGKFTDMLSSVWPEMIEVGGERRRAQPVRPVAYIAPRSIFWDGASRFAASQERVDHSVLQA